MEQMLHVEACKGVWQGSTVHGRGLQLELINCHSLTPESKLTKIFIRMPNVCLLKTGRTQALQSYFFHPFHFHGQWMHCVITRLGRWEALMSIPLISLAEPERWSVSLWRAYILLPPAPQVTGLILWCCAKIRGSGPSAAWGVIRWCYYTSWTWDRKLSIIPLIYCE